MFAHKNSRKRHWWDVGGRLRLRKQAQIPCGERGGNGRVCTQERWLGRARESLGGEGKAPE